MDLFTAGDFKIFDIPGFSERMAAIAGKVRPKLTAIGNDLAPQLSGLVDQPLFVHVAKHARRTVNPPDDTWAALCRNPRGYKKHVHFKVAISRNCVRLLCEVGPEYAEKSEWLASWKREFKTVSKALRSAPELGWYKNEHDEDPSLELKTVDVAELKALPELLISKRDGQFVVGRRIPAKEFAKLSPAALKAVALDTYKPLASLFF
jgi:uncharacterized protein YktB (UPF0637 family)